MNAEHKETHSLLNRLLPWLAVYLALQALLRLALVIANWPLLQHDVLDIAKIFVFGVFTDFIPFILMALMPLCVWMAIPKKWRGGRADRAATTTLFAVVVFIWLFFAAAEWIFYMEFGRRFFFIIYMYLDYAREVLGNIWESYPVATILSGFAVLTAGIIFVMHPWNLRPLFRKSGIGKRVFSTFVMFFLLLLALKMTGIVLGITGRANAEIARNGYYTAVRSFKSMQKAKEGSDYAEYYLTDKNAHRILRRDLDPSGKSFVSSNPADITRLIKGNGDPITPNVVMVMMESLSANFMKSFGNQQNLTPNLDALTAQSVFFTNLFATAHATAYSLQALTVSLPVIFGLEPILSVRDNENLHTAGRLFRSRGYDTAFFYGGDARFNNARQYFSRNSYRVVELKDFRRANRKFVNAWGTEDVGVLNEVMDAADRAHAKGQKFFYQTKTMTNHRPYTYPPGLVEIPSGTSTEGAIQYTDYAIGKFLKQVKKKPWFDDTIFIFVSDHCGYGRGFSEQDDWRDKYNIPALIYAPKLLQPQRVTQMTSQIDLLPTLLGILNWDYTSRFAGKDALKEKIGRAMFMADGGQLVYMTGDNRTTILDKMHLVTHWRGQEQLPTVDPAHQAKAISYFQSASRWRDYLKARPKRR